MSRVTPSCGRAHALAHAHAHTAFEFQLASSQCPLSTGEPPEAVTPERHSAFLRPGFLDSLGDMSGNLSESQRPPGLVDDDTSSDEGEGDSLFENRGKGKGSATESRIFS